MAQAQRTDVGASLLLSLHKSESSAQAKEEVSLAQSPPQFLPRSYFSRQNLLPVPFMQLQNQTSLVYSQQNSYVPYHASSSGSPSHGQVMTQLMVPPDSDMHAQILRYRVPENSGLQPASAGSSVFPRSSNVMLQQSTHQGQAPLPSAHLNFQQLLLQQKPYHQQHQPSQSQPQHTTHFQAQQPIVPPTVVTNNAAELFPVENSGATSHRTKNTSISFGRTPPSGHKRAAALSSEICKALLGKSSEFNSEVKRLTLQGKNAAERRHWFHSNVMLPGLYMITFPIALERRAIVGFEKSEKELKYHATTWSKRAGQGVEAPYVYMRCCPESNNCLARKYVVLFPTTGGSSTTTASSSSCYYYRAMSVYIPGPDAHDCNKTSAYTSDDCTEDNVGNSQVHMTSVLSPNTVAN